MRVAGSHYSGHGALPAVAGIDGVGLREDGSRVFVGGLREPYGTMAERAAVPPAVLMPVPDGLDDPTAAALPNPGVSAWLALSHRAALQPGESVLVLGATGVTGRLAVQAAKLLGAGRVVAAGRNEESLARVAELGADATIKVDDPGADLSDVFASAAGDSGFQVVLDYLWGPPTEALVDALTRHDLSAAGSVTRLVQVGEMAGADIRLPAAAQRSSGLQIAGMGTGTLPSRAALKDAFAAALGGDLVIDTETAPLRDVSQVWGNDLRGRRMVLIP